MKRCPVKSLQLFAVAALATFTMAACSASGTDSTDGTAITPTPSIGTTTTPTATVGATPTAGEVDQCALLSPADLKTVTGGDYGDGVLDEVGRCRWMAGTQTVIAFVIAASLDQFKSNNPGGSDVTVSGHAGYSATREGTTTESLWVDVGGPTLVLEVSGMAADAQAIKLIAQDLAEIAIGNL